MFDFNLLFCPVRTIRSFVAVSVLIGSLGCGPGDPVDEAEALLAEGRAHAAIDLLQPVVREERDNFDAQFFYGQALTMIGEGGLAEWSLRRAMKDPARRQAAAMMIVNNALQGQNPGEAVKILSDMIEEDPENVQLLLARAEAYARTRIDVDKVLEDVDRILELDPENLEAHRAEILAYLQAAMTEEAAEALERLGERIEEQPNAESIGAWYCTTMALFAKESHERELAGERFEACVDEYPAVVSVVTPAVDFFREENQIERAIEVVERAMDLHEGEGDSGFAPLLADLYSRQGRIAEAEALLVEASESENLQTQITYKFKLAEFYDMQGRLDDALEQFDEAAAVLKERESLTDEIEYRLADLAIRAGELDRALEVAAELGHPPFRLMVEARVAQERDEHAKALSLYDEAARLWPDNEFARYHAARSAEQLGDFDKAIELYRHTTRISPDATNSMSRIAVLYYAGGRPIDALGILNLQEQRAPLHEIGELLKLEITVLAGHLENVPAYLASIPPTDAIGVAPRLASVFRGLRLGGEPEQAMEIASRVDTRVFSFPGGDRALEELTRNSGLGSGDLDRVRSIIDAAIELNPKSAGLQAVRGLVAERRGEAAETVAAAYAAALELDPDEPMALLGRARGLVDEDANASLAMGRRALEADSVDTDRVTELASRLMESGAENQALELCRLVLRRTPHDGLAAQMLATAALAQGDSSDRTLDLAHRAARFALSETSVILLRDTYAARGEQAQADELTQRLEARRRSIERDAAAPFDGPDGPDGTGGSDEG